MAERPAISEPAPGRVSPARQPAGGRSRPSRRRWRRAVFVIGPLLLLGAFAYYWFRVRPFESTDDAFIDADVIAIAPQVPGEVIRLEVSDNQLVKRGDPLLEIDPRQYRAGLEQARAGLAAAQTRLEQAEAQRACDQAKVEQEQASSIAAVTEAQRAETDLKRYQSVQSNAVSRTQLDLATAQARSNNAAVEVARSRIKAAQAQTVLSEAAIETAKAEVQRNKAAVRQAELQLSYTKLATPIDGFITHRSVEPGAYVQTGQNLLALVPTNLWVTANFKETQLTHMRSGQPVTIRVDAYPGHVFHAHVDSIQRGSGARFSLLPPENATGNYVKVVQRVPVKILFDDPPERDLPLGPGMSVEPVVRVLPRSVSRSP